MFYDILPHFMVVISDKTSMAESTRKQSSTITQMTINQGAPQKRVIKGRKLRETRVREGAKLGAAGTNFESAESQFENKLQKKIRRMSPGLFKFHIHIPRQTTAHFHGFEEKYVISCPTLLCIFY